MSEDWTTRIRPDLTALWGVEEVHYAWFAPKGWPGKGPTFTLLIPECELQLCKPDPDGGDPLVMINRPQINRNVKTWVRSVCEMARDDGAVVSFGCDTAEQAERAAKMTSKLLPDYERIALERMLSETRARSSLN